MVPTNPYPRCIFDFPPIRDRGRVRPRAPAVERDPRAVAADTIRGALIARLDKLGAERLRDVALDEFGLSWDRWLALLQTIQLALFPEEFAEPPVAAKPARKPKAADSSGLVPAAGLERITLEQMEAFCDRPAFERQLAAA